MEREEFGFHRRSCDEEGVERGEWHALFLLDDEAMRNLNRSDGWEVGSSPSLVIVDEGMAASISTMTLNKGIYAFFFNQRGLMGGLGLQGSKITRIHPPR